MSENKITFRKFAISLGASLVGAALGGVLVKVAISKFGGSRPWALPAIIVGVIAVFVVAALVIPTIVDKRCRAKKRITLTPP